MARVPNQADFDELVARIDAVNTSLDKVNSRTLQNRLRTQRLKNRVETLQGILPAIDASDYVLSAEFDALEATVTAIEARVAANEVELVRIVDLIDPLFLDPVEWAGSHNLNGNNIDMQGGELQSSTGWVRFQDHWDDLRSPGTGVTASGAKKPSFIQFRADGAGSVGVYAYLFPPSVERELFLTVQMPHAWREGTEIEPHVHWSPNDASGGDVLWALEYTYANPNAEAFPLTTTTYGLGAAPGIDKYHIITGYEPDISMANATLSAQLVMRIYRDSTAPEDTYGLGTWFHEMDLHFRLDGLGSNDKLVKSTSFGVPPVGTAPGGGGGAGKDPGTPGTE